MLGDYFMAQHGRNRTAKCEISHARHLFFGCRCLLKGVKNCFYKSLIARLTLEHRDGFLAFIVEQTRFQQFVLSLLKNN